MREIAGAVRTAAAPLEVYRLALARAAPLVGASFGSVFVRDPGDPRLLKLICAHNWPQASARFMGQLRVRIGRGPTGRAVAEGGTVEVEDVFKDPALREWWDPARELGFASLITLPFGSGDATAAVSFYYEAPHAFQDRERRLLQLVADLMAAAAERASLASELDGATVRLDRQNQELISRTREAEEARRLKDEFLANMSHELRTPLTSILGYVYLMSAEHAGPVTDEQALALSKVERSATVLIGLIDDLLELTHVKLGRARVQSGPADAVALARQVVSAAEPAPVGVALAVAAEDESIAIQTDAEKVTRILENLVSNALKFTTAGEVTVVVRRRRLGAGGDVADGGGAIVVRLDATGTGRVHRPAAPDGWVVEWLIRDTGIGIRTEDLDAIFDEFRQVDGSSTRLYGGTGLGLALSLRLARLLDGDLAVESRPGEGSTFILRLPLNPPHAADG